MDSNVVEDSSFVLKDFPVTEKEVIPFEIDYLGNGSFQVTQLNLLMKRSIEPSQNSEAQLSARGLHHRSRVQYEKDIKSTTNIIMLSSLHGGVQNDGAEGQSLQPEYHLFSQYFQRALAYERVGEMDLAINDYNTVLSIYPNYAPAYFNRAGLHNAQGHTKLALKGINRAISIDPSNLLFRKNRSLLLRQKGSYIDAINETMICRALIMQPSLGKELIAGNALTILDSTHLLQSFRESAPVDAVLLGVQWRKKQQLLAAQKSHTRERRQSLTQQQLAAIALAHPTPGEVVSDDAVVEFLTEIPFFSSYSSDRRTIGDFASKLELETVEKDCCVFRTGDAAVSLFIVLSGEVAFLSDQMLHSNGRKRVVSDPFLKVVQRAGRGAVFGEQSLRLCAEEEGTVSATVRRTMNAVCTQPSTVLVLRASDYYSIAKNHDAELRKEMKRMILSCKPFSNFEDSKINYLVSRMQLRYFGMAEEVLSSGCCITQLCIVRSGVVKLIKSLPRPVTHSSSDLPLSPSLPSLAQRRPRSCSSHGTYSATQHTKSSTAAATAHAVPRACSAARGRGVGGDRDREGSARPIRKSDDKIFEGVGVGSAHLSGLDPPGMWVIEKKWMDPEDDKPKLTRRKSSVMSRPATSSSSRHTSELSAPLSMSPDAAREAKQAQDLRNVLRSCSPTQLSRSRDRAGVRDSSREQWSSTVGLLGAGQIFGEICVLSPKSLSSISGTAYTKVELFTIAGEDLIAQGIRFDSHCMNWLNQSFNLYNPSAEKISYYFKSKYAWEKEKEKIVSGILKESTRIQARLGRKSQK